MGVGTVPPTDRVNRFWVQLQIRRLHKHLHWYTFLYFAECRIKHALHTEAIILKIMRMHTLLIEK